MPIDDHAHAVPIKPKLKPTSRIVAERRTDTRATVVEKLLPFAGGGVNKFVVLRFEKRFFRSEEDALDFCKEHYKLTWDLHTFDHEQIGDGG